MRSGGWGGAGSGIESVSDGLDYRTAVVVLNASKGACLFRVLKSSEPESR